MAAERPRLVRFCARVSGDWPEAEDLAQQALMEAWRLRARLREPEATGRWLAAIARRVCWRWRRERGRPARAAPAPGARGAAGADPESAWPEPAAALDIEAELERGELAELLDRAMGLIPAPTRRVLVERYVRESPHAEIAGRLGLSEGAVTMRVQRGKLLLRRILTTRFPDEARALGLAVTGDWDRTRIWCPNCGARRLWARWLPGRRPVFECRGCCGRDRIVMAHGWTGELLWGRPCEEVLGGVGGWKPILNRMAAATFAAYGGGVQGLRARCAGCLRPSRAQVGSDGQVWTRCEGCGVANVLSTAGGVAFAHPAMQAFWRRHERIRSLPDLAVEACGLPATVVRVESRADASSVAVTIGRNSLVPLAVHVSGAP